MIDHIGIVVRDYDQSRAFYAAALAPLGYTVQMEFTIGAGADGKPLKAAGFGKAGKPSFWISSARGDAPASAGAPLHLAFHAGSRAGVDAYYAAAIAAGGKDNGGPGPRPQYHPGYYGAFVFDPDGNNTEAVCHDPKG